MSDVTLCTQSHLGRSEYAAQCTTSRTSNACMLASMIVRRLRVGFRRVHFYFCVRYLNIRLSDKFLSLIKFLLNVTVGLSVASISPSSGRRHDRCRPFRDTRAHTLSSGVRIRVDHRPRFGVCPLPKLGTRTQIGDFYALIDIF